MRFLFVGTGGVGGFFGAKLARAGNDVWFVARGSHLAAMKKSGLTVHSTEGTYSVSPDRITGNPSDAGPCDVVFVCVKSYDTEDIARSLGEAVSPSSIIISLQNGIDNEEKIARHLTTGTVWGGVSYIYAAITAPGEVTETGGPKKIFFGPLTTPTPSDDERGGTICNLMTAASIDAIYTTDIHLRMWKKFIFISAVGGLTALARLTLGEILSTNESRSLLEEAMREPFTIALARGIPIEPEYISSVFNSFARTNTNTYSSMYHDLINRKPMELEAFAGTVIREGKRLGIPTPVHRAIYAALLPHHRKHSRSTS